MTIILDPGHGMANKKAGIYDPGAVSNGVTEAEIVMDWANELKEYLNALVIRLSALVSMIKIRVLFPNAQR